MARSYRGGSGWTGPLVAVLALGAILGGLVYAFRDRIAEDLGEEPAPVARKARRETPKRVAERVEKVEVVEKPAAKLPPRAAPRREVSAYDRKRAAELHLRGEAALKELEFDEAAELFRKEGEALGNDPDAAGRANAFRDKAEVFGRITDGVRINPEAEGGLVTLKRDGGDIPDVVIVDETDDSYVIRKRNGIEFEVPRAEVYAVDRMTPEAQRRNLLDRFRKAERASDRGTGIANFLLARHAYQDGLKEPALEYLEKAYAKDGEGLPRNIRLHEAKTKLGYAYWCEGTGRTSLAKMWCGIVEREFEDLPEMTKEARELRDRMASTAKVASARKSTVKIRVVKKRAASRPRPAATAGTKVASAPSASSAPSAPSAPSAKDEEVTFVAEEVKSRSSANSAVMSEINKTFKEAMDHYLAGRPGNPNSNMHLSKAAQLFDKVVNLCDKALAKDPGNSQILSRQADASRYSYHARKMKTLGLFGG